MCIYITPDEYFAKVEIKIDDTFYPVEFRETSDGDYVLVIVGDEENGEYEIIN